MKGSVGTVSGGVRSVGVGAAIASSGKMSAGNFGFSHSPEASFGGSSSKFSSRNLSMFNREVISKSSYSIVNINKGKETKSPFARTPSLAHSRSMFDVTRPVMTHPASRPSEFGIRINPKDSRESHFSKARIQTLATSQPVFNISKKQIPEFGKKIIIGKVDKPTFSQNPVQKTSEAGINPQTRSEWAKSVSPLKDTVILWQKKDTPSGLKLEATGKTIQMPDIVQKVFLKETKSIGKTPEVRTVINTKIETHKLKRVEKAKTPKREKLGRKIIISHDTPADVKKIIYKDIKEAQKIMIPIIIKSRVVSYDVAMQEALELLSKKYEGKVKVIPAVKLQFQPEVKIQTEKQAVVQSQINVQTEVKPETSLKQENNTKEIAKKSIGRENTLEEKKLYFKKDEQANIKRIKRITETFQKLRRWGKREITGADIIYEMGPQTDEEISELTRIQGVDYRLNSLMRVIKYMKEIKDIKTFLEKVKEYVSYYSAVRLTYNEEGEKAVGQDAIEVYGRPLYNVSAYVEEENSKGVLRASASATKVKVIRSGKEVTFYDFQKEKKAPQTT